MKKRRERAREKRATFFINDHVDILVEVMKRLDDRSLGVAECVCRLWCSISRNESLWEHLCFGHHHAGRSFSKSVRPVVMAVGGYKRLYMVCLRPVLNRLQHRRRPDRRPTSGVTDEVQLSLSLLCVDYYERLNPSSTSSSSSSAATSSLMFLNNGTNRLPYPINA